MANFFLTISLILFVALDSVCETLGAGMSPRPLNGTLTRLLNTYPKMRKDFEPYAYKGMLEVANELEGKCLATTEFKDFFAKFRDYIDYCFNSGSKDISIEMSGKSEQLSRAMSALSGSYDKTSMYYWLMIDSLVTMEKVVVEGRKNNSEELLDKLHMMHILKWAAITVLYVKEASQIKGKAIDISSFDVSDKEPEIALYNKTNNITTQDEPFSLPLYLQNFPKISKDFEPYAYKGMLDFVGELEGKCLGSKEFKYFFHRLKLYMECFKSDADDNNIEFNNEVVLKSKLLFISISALSGTKGGTLDSWYLVDGLLSMGEVLREMKKQGSKVITFEEKRELTWSIVKWARAISLFLKTASQKKGVHIDLSSFDNYYDSHVLTIPKGAHDKIGRDHPNGTINSNSTKPN